MHTETKYWVMVVLRNGTWKPSHYSDRLGGLNTHREAEREVMAIRRARADGVNVAMPAAIVKCSVHMAKTQH